MTGRYVHLDGLRGAAALLVVVHHGVTLLDFAIYSGNPADSHFSWDVELAGLPFVLLNSGSFAVCVFFVLSAFVLARSFSRTALSVPATVVKRYVRLSVPILAANLFAFAVFAPLTARPLPGALSTGRSVADVVHAFGYCVHEALVKATLTGLSGGTYNGVLWTMQVEFWGSIALIAAFAIARRRAGPAAALLCLILAFTWNSYVGLFGAGALLYLAGPPRPARPGPWRAPGDIFLLGVALLLGTLPLGPVHPLFYDPLLFLFGGTAATMAPLSLTHPLLAALGAPDWVPWPIGPFVLWHGVGAILLVATSNRSAMLQSVLSRPFFQWLGRLSFPLYLVHATLRETVAGWLLRAGLDAGLGYAAASGLALTGYVVAALLVADIFARLFERRATAWASLAGAWTDVRARALRI